MTPELNTAEGGEFCTCEKTGNAMQWIWVEIIAFQANVIVIMIQLVQSFFESTTLLEPKNADLIYCIDGRPTKQESKEGKTESASPRYHIFNLMLDEVYSVNFFKKSTSCEFFPADGQNPTLSLKDDEDNQLPDQFHEIEAIKCILESTVDYMELAKELEKEIGELTEGDVREARLKKLTDSQKSVSIS